MANRPARTARFTVAALTSLAVFAILCLPGSARAQGNPPSYLGISWEVVPHPACPDSVVRIRFDACHCNVDLKSVEITSEGLVVLRAQVAPFIVCGVCDPRSLEVALGKFAVGNYVQKIRIDADVVDSSGTTHPESASFDVPFSVLESCLKYPGRILPFLDQVIIGRAIECPDCPQSACAGDSIDVFLAGAFPNTCVWLEEVRVLPSPVVGPLPQPDVVEIVYGHNSCLRVACNPVITPWNAHVRIGQLLPGPYGLMVETVLNDDCAGMAPEPIGHATLPFVVQSCDSLPPPGGCMDARFVQRPGGVCDDFVAPGQPGHATFEVASAVPLAGLQGSFVFDRPGLHVSAIETTGAASGFQLFWDKDSNGAHFVLYSDDGRLLPPHIRDWSQPWEPVLRLTVDQNSGVPSIDQVRFYFDHLLGADSTGHEVNLCPHPQRDEVGDFAATFCSAGSCDANHDGRSDVRDLVIMAMCIWGGVCPDTSGGAFDCDGNGVVDLSDVMCCAHHVLDQRPPGGEKGDSLDDHVSVAMGAPRAVDGGWDVPVFVNGASHLGAARLDLSYPSDRYDIAGVDLPSVPGWLALSQHGEGSVALAWIAAGSSPTMEPEIDVQRALLHLQLKPGAKDGGDISIASGQFASTTGTAVKVATAGLSLPLAGGRVALSSPLPNPSSGRTSFSVTLSTAAALDVGVFDAGGRRIATVFHGDADAGVRSFTWDGRRDSGIAAGSGLFFVRAEAGGTRVTSKVLLLSPR
jgi:hypothetical protein